MRTGAEYSLPVTTQANQGPAQPATDLTGKCAVVGGASGGLGFAVANALAASGCRVALWARDLVRVQAARELLEERHGGQHTAFAADATSPDCARTVADHVRNAFGHADIVVLNAGGPPPADPTATTPEAWATALQMLLLTPVALATELLPEMRTRGWGRVLAVLSSGVRQPLEGLVYSNAGRAALAAWLKTTASVVARDGVTVNGLLPGRIATARVAQLDSIKATQTGRSADEIRAESEASIPTGRYGTADEFAALAAFLASPAASYVTGTMIAADGGLIRSW